MDNAMDILLSIPTVNSNGFCLRNLPCEMHMCVAKSTRNLMMSLQRLRQPLNAFRKNTSLYLTKRKVIHGHRMVFYNWLSCDYQYRYLCSLCKGNRFAFTKIIGVEEL